MPLRSVPLANDEIYHVFSRSIVGTKIFVQNSDYERLVDTIDYYTMEKPFESFSYYMNLSKQAKAVNLRNSEKIVEIIAYCIMPTHFHLILKQIKDNGISTCVGQFLNSYTKFFNTRYKRKGTLWEGRFRNVLVDSDEQLLHLSRYVHLNPVTAYLVNKPEEWKYSSYREYIQPDVNCRALCNYSDYLDMDIPAYRDFVNDQVDYQRELSRYKHLYVE